MSYPVLFTATFHNQPSLTLNAILYGSDGVQVGSTITTGFVNLGNGVYHLVATIPDGHVGTLVIYDSATPSRCYGFAVNPVEIELNALASAILSRSRSHTDNVAEDGSLYEAIGILTQALTLGTILRIYKSDGVTVFNERTLTLDDTALPVTGVA